MRIQMLVNVTDRSGTYRRGDVVDVPEAVASSLIARGRALPVAGGIASRGKGREPVAAAEGASVSTETEGELESAALGEPPETAAEKKPRRKQAGK